MSEIDREAERKFIEEHNRTHLIRYVSGTNMNALEDILLIMAKNIEAAMHAAGAEPGKDYTYRDLFTMALPFALEMFKNDSNDITFSSENF